MEKLEKKNKFGTLQLIQEGTLLREGRGGRRFTVIDIVSRPNVHQMQSRGRRLLFAVD